MNQIPLSAWVSSLNKPHPLFLTQIRLSRESPQHITAEKKKAKSQIPNMVSIRHVSLSHYLKVKRVVALKLCMRCDGKL